ncbi:MAG: cupin domain-containing protein [Flavobacteriia bacterium]|nr:cupin domain-containing protein [Flavobacteriia bacterium]
MKKTVAIGMLAAFLGCTEAEESKTAAETTAKKSHTTAELKDYGPEPFTVDIDEVTKANHHFRTTLWTGSNLQVTLMSIPVGGEIGLEQHNELDQFLRIEAGEGKVYMGDTAENLDFVQEVGDDFSIMVPAGKWHNLKNTGNEPLKLYSIYAPIEHPKGTVHETKAESDAAEHH